MELLKLPEQGMSMLFGPNSIFANWITFFVANWIVISLGGFILSNWMNKKPDGIIDRGSLSEKISEKSSWYLPFAVLGITCAFIYNVFIYSVFFILEVTRFITDFLYKWIKFLLIWIWQNVLSPSIWMLLKVAYHYAVFMPFKSLIRVIQTVPSILNRSFYMGILWPTLIGSIVSALLIFVGFIFKNDEVGEYGPLVVGSLVLTWIVAKQIYGTKDAAMKSVLFTLVLSGFALGLVGVFYFLNKGDASVKWGGTLAGIMHAPTIIGSLIVGMISLSLLFSSSIGVIFSNTNDEKNWIVKIRLFFVESFKRSLSFCYQYLMVAIVGLVITILPIAILQMVSEQAGESLVNVHLNDEKSAIKKELDVFTTSDEIALLMNVDSTNELKFSKELDSLKHECELSYQLSENELFSSYISDAGKFGVELSPVNTREQFDERVEAGEKKLKELEESKKQQLEDLDESIKSYTNQMDEAERSLTGIVNNQIASDYYNELIASCKKEIAHLEALKSRTGKYNDVLIAGNKANQDELNGNWSSYSSSYLFYLLAKYALFSLIITFFFGLFAMTVQATYDDYTGSAIVAAFENEKAKNANQPWLAFILLGALAFAAMNPSKVIDEPLKWVNSTMKKMTNDNSGQITEDPKIQSDEQSASVPESNQNDATIEDTTVADVADIEDVEMNGPEYFYCNDGRTIPLAYYNDGGCDCSTCEDEN